MGEKTGDERKEDEAADDQSTHVPESCTAASSIGSEASGVVCSAAHVSWPSSCSAASSIGSQASGDVCSPANVSWPSSSSEASSMGSEVFGVIQHVSWSAHDIQQAQQESDDDIAVLDAALDDMLDSQPPGSDFVLDYIADTIINQNQTNVTNMAGNVTVINSRTNEIIWASGSLNNIGALLLQADRINELLTARRPPELSQGQRAKVLHVMALANVDPLWLDPALWAALCGVPTERNPWGDQIAHGIIHWAAEYFRKAKRGWWMQGAEIRFGWFLLPENKSKDRSRDPPQPCDRHWFPCVYMTIGGIPYMICVHLLIYLMKMWCVHPQRLVEWV